MQIKLNYELGLIIVTPKIYLGLGERERGGEIQENQNPEFFCYQLLVLTARVEMGCHLEEKRSHWV